ncbi:hypothetical protein H5410_002163 [Solanum commersonii]|uniref:Uncharacterized protein n=1 Tax=Solanum commersonii TaxID=4109 RepID=A0A9J6B141_SOLCO|nr:hypothetical protein H5410_002163 [Solanum commersonii]
MLRGASWRCAECSFSSHTYLLLRGSAHWNIRRDLGPFDDLPNSLGDPHEVSSLFLQSICSILIDTVKALYLNPNT